EDRASGERPERRANAQLPAAGDARDDGGGAPALDLDAPRLGLGHDLGAGRTRVDEICPQRRLLRAATASQCAGAAVATALDVAADRRARPPQPAQTALEHQVGTVALALVGVDV